MREVVQTNKYIRFVKVEEREKTSLWLVENNKSGYCLGSIEWSRGWRQYVFQPSSFTEFNNTCLTEIADFLDRQNKAQRGKP